MLLPRKRRLRRAAGLSLVLLAACQAASHAPAPAPGPAALAARGAASPANQPAFQTLAAAIEEGDDELATRIVASLRARPLAPRELDMVASAERVLRGRALVRTLDLELASEPVADEGTTYRLVLLARSRGTELLRLNLPPCDLKRLRASMDARGLEGFEFESKASTALAALELVPGGERRIELLTYELPLGRALGVRERWRLETRSGEIECAGEVYPAASVKVTGCERERLSPLLAAGTAPPGGLAERLETDPPAPRRELLELALRIESTEREAALRALAPVVDELARTRPERVAAAEPALRWLTQNRDLGQDPSAWARYLAARVTAGAAGEEGNLDLPVGPRPTRRDQEAER